MWGAWTAVLERPLASQLKTHTMVQRWERLSACSSHAFDKGLRRCEHTMLKQHHSLKCGIQITSHLALLRYGRA